MTGGRIDEDWFDEEPMTAAEFDAFFASGAESSAPPPPNRPHFAGNHFYTSTHVQVSRPSGSAPARVSGLYISSPGVTLPARA